MRKIAPMRSIGLSPDGSRLVSVRRGHPHSNANAFRFAIAVRSLSGGLEDRIPARESSSTPGPVGNHLTCSLRR